MNNFRILLFDRNPNDRLLLEQALRPRFDRISISQATSLEALSMRRGPFELAIIHDEVKAAEAREAARAIRKISPECFLALFSVDPPEKSAAAIDFTADMRFRVLRPGDVEALLSLVLSLVQDGPTRDSLSAALADVAAKSTFDRGLEVSGILSLAGTILSIHPSEALALGFLKNELIGQDAISLIHPEDIRRTRRSFQLVLKKPEAVEQAVFRARSKDGRWRWLEVVCVNKLTDPRIKGIVINCRDITEKKWAGRALTDAASIVTGEGGERFFNDAVCSISRIMDVETAFIGELSGKSPATMRILALHSEGSTERGAQIPLAGSPCEEALKRRLCCYPNNVRHYFPNDPNLARLNAEAYLGLPIARADGEVLGIIAVVSRRPLRRTKALKAVLQIFAMRALIELEWLRPRSSPEEKIDSGVIRAEGEVQADLVFKLQSIDTIVDCSSNVESILGFSQHELLGKSWLDLVAPAQTADVAAACSLAFTGFAQQVEHDMRFKSGGWRSLSSFVSVVAGHLLIAARDVTGERRAAREAQVNAKRSAAVARLGRWAMSEHDRKSLMTFACVIAAEALEADGACVWKRNSAGVLHPIATYRWPLELHGKALQAGGATPIEVTIEKRRATIVDDYLTEKNYVQPPPFADMQLVSSLSVPMFYGPAICGALCVQSRSRSKFNREDASFLESISSILTAALHGQDAYEVQRLTSAVEQSADHVMITDRQGIIEYVNPAFEEQTGYSRDDVIGKTPRILKSGKQSEDFYKRLWEIIHSGKVFRGVVVNRKKDGELFCEEKTIAPMKDARGQITHFVSTGRDITERQKLEERLRQSQRLEAIGKLAGGIAHDFNNLLTAIIGYSELLLLRNGVTPEIRDDATEIKNIGRRAADLTRQLLAFSRRQILAPRIINLNTLTEGMLKMLRRLISENIVLEAHLDPATPAVLADKGQIEQVLTNLVVNARDAMDKGGRISITTKLERLTRSEIFESNTFPPGDYACLAVDDTGSGIPPEVLKHIFEPFFSTKEEGRGTGLGLSTVYGIVAQSGGFLRARSTVGRGTHFEILLPSAGRSPLEIAAQTAPTASGKYRSSTLLLVEDEPEVRAVTARILRNEGYHVLEAPCSVDALRIGESHSSIQIVVSDIILPDLHGSEMVDRLLQHHPSIKSLFISGFTDDERLRKRIATGEVNFLQKPFTAAELLEKLARIGESQ